MVMAEKIWLFVHPAFSTAFIDAVYDTIERMREAKEDVSSWREGCPFPFHHKNIMITPEFLREYKIPYQMVCQRPGTLVYVREGVYHQVVNTGLMLAEAVNVGGPSWNCMSVQPRYKCPNGAIKPIVRNCAYDEKVISFKVSYLPCRVDGCLHVAPTSGGLKAHARQHSDRANLLSCRFCIFTYVHQSALKNRLLSCHPEEHAKAEFTLCSTCGVLFNTPGLRRHQLKCLGGDVTCDRCHRTYSSRGYRNHRKTCNFPVRHKF